MKEEQHDLMRALFARKIDNGKVIMKDVEKKFRADHGLAETDALVVTPPSYEFHLHKMCTKKYKKIVPMWFTYDLYLNNKFRASFFREPSPVDLFNMHPVSMLDFAENICEHDAETNGGIFSYFI